MEGLNTKVNEPITIEKDTPPESVETRDEKIKSAEKSVVLRFKNKIESAEEVLKRLQEQPYFADLERGL